MLRPLCRAKMSAEEGSPPMSPEPARKEAKRGDLVVVARHHVGESERVGEILELLGDPAHPRYRVRWEDGHESIYHPSSDAVIRHKTRARKEKT
jgi:hypothetical protein